MADHHPGRINRIVVFSLAGAFVGYSVYVHLHAGEAASPPRLDAVQARGYGVWRRNDCQACHQIYGTGGYFGPDLTNVVSRRSSERIHSALREGSPPMPPFNLTRADREALIEFLRYVDRTGIWPRSGWPPRAFPEED